MSGQPDPPPCQRCGAACVVFENPDKTYTAVCVNPDCGKK